MRSFYSLFFVLLVSFALPIQAAVTYESVRDEEGCGEPETSGTVFCRLLQRSWHATKGSVPADGVSAVNHCKDRITRVRICCSSKGCPGEIRTGGENEASQAYDKFNEIMHGGVSKGGMNPACKDQSTLSKLGADVHFGLAGICRAQMGLFDSECGEADKIAGLTAEQKTELEKFKADRKKYKKDDLFGAGNAHQSGHAAASLCKDNTTDLAGKDPSSKPSGPGGSSDTPNSGSPGGGGGGNPMGGFNPASMMNNNNQQPQIPPRQECSQNPMLAGCDCVTNPNQEHCKKSDSFNIETASVQESGSVDANNFNVPDAPISSGSSDENPFVAEPARVNPVAGNGTPFGLGGSGAASLPGGQNTGGFGIQPSKTDIMRGEGGGGGGFAAMAAGMNMKSGEEGGGYGGYNGAPKPERLNLSDWLPGGAKDPTRKLAGQQTQSPEISHRNVNMYERITNAINRRCAEGRLKDCVPYK